MEKLRENIKLISLLLLATLIILVSTQCLRKKTNEIDAITNIHLLAAFLISQGGDKIYGSCNIDVQKCEDCIGWYTPKKCEFFCDGNGTYSSSACPLTNPGVRVGSCRSEGHIIRSYFPKTEISARSDCDNDDGVFTAG